MQTAERLAGYGINIPSDVLFAVQDVAERQRAATSYPQFLQSVGIDETMIGRPVVDIIPRDCDPEQALLVHLPMANPLDANQLFHIGTIAATLPNRRIIAFANKSGGFYRAYGPRLSGLRRMTSGDFRPAVEHVARYVDKRGIERVDQYGGSYGAELAIAYGRASNVLVRSTLLVEPVSVKSRTPKELLEEFQSSEAPIAGYVEAVGVPIYNDARSVSIKGLTYISGVLHPSNAAAWFGMAKGKFAENMNGMIDSGVGATNVVSGTLSELAEQESLRANLDELRARHGMNKVRSIEIPGQYHSMANDIHLSAALVSLSVGNQ